MTEMTDTDGPADGEPDPAENRDPTDEGTDRRDEQESPRWLTEPVLDAELPPDVREAVHELLGGEAAIETLGEWIDEVRRLNGGGPIDVDRLCHAEDETGHWGEIDGDRYHFACFYDAVILSALAEEPVRIRTESPAGHVIEARAVGTESLTVSPDTAVVSFGIDSTVGSPETGELSPETLYAAVCPYVKAFRTPAAYEAWAESTGGATVAMPLSGATDVAAALVA